MFTTTKKAEETTPSKVIQLFSVPFKQEEKKPINKTHFVLYEPTPSREKLFCEKNSQPVLTGVNYNMVFKGQLLYKYLRTS